MLLYVTLQMKGIEEIATKENFFTRLVMYVYHWLYLEN